jgi:hypothetical protein
LRLYIVTLCQKLLHKDSERTRSISTAAGKDGRRPEQEARRRWWSAGTPTCIACSPKPENFKSEMPRSPGWEQFNKIMFAQFVTQMDGEQHARVTAC